MSIRGDDGTASGLTPPASYAIWGDSGVGSGVVGTSNGDNRPGVLGLSQEVRAAGVEGNGRNIGVRGLGFVGVSGDGTVGVAGTSNSSNGAGVLATSSDGMALRARCGGAGLGILSEASGIGIVTSNSTSLYKAILASTFEAATFVGPVFVHGALFKLGGGFLVDHPTDPANKYLSHSFVESPDRKNVYDGIAVLDPAGEAEVELPEWFGALNRDFRYQLTCLGGHASVFVSQEIEKNRFRISGGAPGLRVSWQVTGIRQDAWAKANPLTPEEAKPEAERGTFLEPALFGEPEEKNVWRVRHPSPPAAPSLLADPRGAAPAEEG